MRTSNYLLVDKLSLPTTFAVLGEHTAMTGTIDLAKCENCYTSPRALGEVARALIEPRYLFGHWNAQPRKFRTMLAELHDVPTKQIFLVRGGMGGIRYAFEVLARPGSRIGLLKPDFPFWWDAQRARTKVIWLESCGFPFAHNTEDIAQFASSKQVPFVMFSNPNAWTGTKKSAMRSKHWYKRHRIPSSSLMRPMRWRLIQRRFSQDDIRISS